MFSEEQIYSIIEDIARDVKVIIREHLHPYSFREGELINKRVMKCYEGLPEVVKRNISLTLNCDYEEPPKGECFVPGEEVHFIKDGVIHKGKIDGVLFDIGGFTTAEVFRSNEDLIEHLKKRVHG